MKFFTRKNFLQVAALVGGLGFVYTAFSAPPGSPYNLGETLAPTCAPGDANCTVVTPLQSGANASATLGIGTSSAPDAAVEIDTDTTGFPDSWAENLKLTSQQYPALWFHAENNNEGWLIGNGDGSDLSIATTDGTAIGDYRFIIEEGGFVGIGTTNPNELLELSADTDADLDIYSANTTNADWSDISIYHSRGTIATPLISQDGDDIAELNIFAHDGAGYEPLASIGFIVDGTPGADDMPGGITFRTTADGANSLTTRMFVDNAGFVGIGTIDPEANLHLWGDGANGSNAELRFGDNGNILLRELGAGDSDALYIYGDSGVYIDSNTNEPALSIGQATFLTGGDAEELVITDSGSSDTAIAIENDEGVGTYVYEIHVEDSNEFVIYQNHDENSDNSVLMYNGATQHWGFGTDPTANELQMDSGAHITAGGVFTDASSRAFKTGIESITLEEAKLALQQLDPVRFQYKEQLGEEYLGFIAEDVPDLVATADRKGLAPMDIVAVLVKVNQDQQTRIDRLEQELEALKQIVNSL